MEMPKQTLANILAVAVEECQYVKMFDGIPICKMRILPCARCIEVGKYDWLTDTMISKEDEVIGS